MPPDRHPRGRDGRRRARAGYTLIELVTAMALMLIITAFAIPKVASTRFQMDANARLIRSVLQVAERLSVTRQYDVIVSFDLSRGMMRTVEDMDNDGQMGSAERASWRALEDGGRFGVPSSGVGGGGVGAAVVGGNLRTVDGMPSVIFHRNGAASSDVQIYLTSRVGAASDFRAVTVMQSTGRTEWFRRNGSVWKEAGL
jgi:prepilin-type N-terminal cleavage/methylation domain-containing protein